MAESIGLGPGVRKEHLAHRNRRPRDQHLGEVDHRLVRFRRERVVERQLAHLRRRRLHQTLVVEAQGRAPQPGDAFDIFLPGLIPHPHTFAAGDHDRSNLLVRLEVGVRVQHVGDVACGGRVCAEGRGRCHEGLLLDLWVRLALIPRWGNSGRRVCHPQPTPKRATPKREVVKVSVKLFRRMEHAGWQARGRDRDAAPRYLAPTSDQGGTLQCGAVSGGDA